MKKEESPFWRAVRELAAMRDHIPPERRAGSLVRQAFAEEKARDRSE